MTKRAILHTMHSQVADTVSNLHEDFDLIISMDSHLDISFNADADCYPKQLEPYMRRTGIHTTLRHMFGDLPALRKSEDGELEPAEMIIVISEGTFTKHAVDTTQTMGSVALEARLSRTEDPLTYYQGLLERTFDFRTYLSPPNKLVNLIPITRDAFNWLLDIDVDYMADMQNECFTRITNALSGDLQYMTHVLNFIQKSQPETITISEAKTLAMNNPKSHFSTFLGKLKSMGYKIEKGAIFQDDEETLRRVKDCEDFYRTTTKGLVEDDLRQGGDLEAVHEVEKVKAREFFEARGYSF